MLTIFQIKKKVTSQKAPYDFSWPQGAEFGRLNMSTLGTVFANVQNKHSAPGICTLSGDTLFKLYRATGNSVYLELMRDIAHSLPQYVSRRDRAIRSSEGGRELPSGWVNERVNLSDWEGEAMVGGVFYGSCWSEVSVMLTYAEIPGLYVQPDIGFFLTTDHIEVERTDRSDERFSLLVHNPTEFKATVKIFSEFSTDMSTPLGQNGLYDCQRET